MIDLPLQHTFYLLEKMLVVVCGYYWVQGWVWEVVALDYAVEQAGVDASVGCLGYAACAGSIVGFEAVGVAVECRTAHQPIVRLVSFSALLAVVSAKRPVAALAVVAVLRQPFS